MPSVDVAGTELYYERSGSGEPLVLIQGMSATHLAWGRPFLSELEGDFECIVFDNRGIGRSGQAEMPFSIADLAADTVGLLDALGIESAHVMGISMGGMIAQEVALSAPDRVRTLTIGASFCGGEGSSLMEPDDLQELGTAFASGDPEAVRRVMWKINVSPNFRADEEHYEPFREMASALPAPAPVVMQQMRAVARHNTSDRLATIEVPTMVIHGTADRLIKPSNGEQIARLMSLEPTLIEDVGHLFWWEQPSQTADLVRAHALASA